jgi:predicted TIM-barrel fold metal-dependent hydrolase
VPTVIDIHTHVFPDQLAPAAIARFEDAGTVKAFYDGTVAGLTSVMDASGIDISVTQAVATKPSQVRSINDWTASTATHRIIPFGAMHPDVEDPWAEIAHAHALGLRGIKMHPEFQHFSPDEPRVRPILDAALEFGMIVFMHAGEDVTLDTLHGTPSAFSRMLDAYPDLTVVLAHMGGWQQWDGVLRELVGRHDFWVDTAYTLGHLPDERFVELVRAHGADKVLFGSDGPWTDPAAEIAHLARLGFAQAELDALLGGNAERLLGL